MFWLLVVYNSLKLEDEVSSWTFTWKSEEPEAKHGEEWKTFSIFKGRLAHFELFGERRRPIVQLEENVKIYQETKEQDDERHRRMAWMATQERENNISAGQFMYFSLQRQHW